MTATRTVPPMLRSAVLRAVRSSALRVLIAGAVLIALGAFLQLGFSGWPYRGLATGGSGLVAAVTGAVMLMRDAQRPEVRTVLESPGRVVSVTSGATGATWSMRLILDDGRELSLNLAERDSRKLASVIATFCKHAEIRLPWMQRAAQARVAKA